MGSAVETRADVFGSVSQTMEASASAVWTALTTPETHPFGAVTRPGDAVREGDSYEWRLPGAGRTWPRWRVVAQTPERRQVSVARGRATQVLNGWPDVAVVVDVTGNGAESRVDATIRVRRADTPVGQAALPRLPFALHHLEGDVETALAELAERMRTL